MSDIDIRRDGAVTIIEFNRPEKKNAFTAFFERRKPDFSQFA